MSKQSTIDKQAEVRALLVRGYTSPKIEALTGIPESTVRTWKQGWPNIDAEQEQALMGRSIELAAAADRLQLRELEHLEAQEPGSAVKYLMVLNAISGTQRDKLQRRGDRNINIGVFNVQESRKELDAAIPGEYEVRD